MQLTRVTVHAQILPAEAHFCPNLHSTPPTVGRKQQDQVHPSLVMNTMQTITEVTLFTSLGCPGNTGRNGEGFVRWQLVEKGVG